MERIIKAVLILSFLCMSACANHQNLNAPCPDYGKRCPQQPVNGWG